MERRLGYAEDRALHVEYVADEALGTIKSYMESNEKVRVVRPGF